MQRYTEENPLVIEGPRFSYGTPRVTIQPFGRWSELSDSAYDSFNGIVMSEYGQLQSLIDLPGSYQQNDNRMMSSGDQIVRILTINDGSENYGFELMFMVDDTKGTIPVSLGINLLHNISHSLELWAQTDGNQPVVTEPAFERVRRQNVQEFHTAMSASNHELVGAGKGSSKSGSSSSSKSSRTSSGPGSVQRS